jgi:hypothetical protein
MRVQDHVPALAIGEGDVGQASAVEVSDES